jgi:hypothetical protein
LIKEEEMSGSWGPFTGRQLTTIIVSLIVGAALLPSAVWAVDTFSNVAIEDPVSGVKARVDATNRLKVSDRPAPPATPFQFNNDIGGTLVFVLGPVASSINLTSLSIGVDGAQPTNLQLRAFYVPSGNTTCSNTVSSAPLWHSRNITGTIAIAFPTPLQAPQMPGLATCLGVVPSGPSAIANGSGYLS